MRVSTNSRIAVAVLGELVGAERPVNAEELSERIATLCVPCSSLRRVCFSLSMAGLIRFEPKAPHVQAGYLLGADPTEITLAAVILAVEPDAGDKLTAPPACRRACSALRDAFEGITLADLTRTDTQIAA